MFIFFIGSLALTLPACFYAMRVAKEKGTLLKWRNWAWWVHYGGLLIPLLCVYYIQKSGWWFESVDFLYCSITYVLAWSASIIAAVFYYRTWGLLRKLHKEADELRYGKFKNFVSNDRHRDDGL